MKVLVERPNFPAFAFVHEIEILDSVHEHFDLLERPFHLIHMKRSLRIGHAKLRGLLRIDAPVILVRVYGSLNPTGIIAHVLHDIDLAVVGPTAVAVRPLRGQHPNRRPSAASGRQVRANFKTAVGSIAFAFGDHARRRVFAAVPVFAPRFDDELAAFHARIFGAPRDVVLQFLIAPAMTAAVELNIALKEDMSATVTSLAPLRATAGNFSLAA